MVQYRQHIMECRKKEQRAEQHVSNRGNQKAGRSIREDHGAVFQTRRQGSEGRDRIYQREATTGEGVVKVYEIKLDKVRIAEYKVEAEDEAVPTETFTLTYTEISQNVSVQDGAGMANTGDVTFDLASATLTSAMKDALK